MLYGMGEGKSYVICLPFGSIFKKIKNHFMLGRIFLGFIARKNFF